MEISLDYSESRQLVMNTIAANGGKPLSHEQLDAVAARMLIQAARKLAERWQAEYHNSLLHNAAVYERMFYPLLAPRGKTIEKTLPDGTRTRQAPPRQAYRVKIKDLPKFAKEHGLNARELEKVGLGEIHDHRGWTRGPSFHHPDEMGTAWTPPFEPAPRERITGLDNNRPILELETFAAPVIDYDPDAPEEDFAGN